MEDKEAHWHLGYPSLRRPPRYPLTVPRPSRHIQLGQPPPRRMRGAASGPGRAQALTATDKGPSGWSERARGSRCCRSARRWRRRSQRAFCCVVRRGIYPRLHEPRDPRDTLPHATFCSIFN